MTSEKFSGGIWTRPCECRTPHTISNHIILWINPLPPSADVIKVSTQTGNVERNLDSAVPLPVEGALCLLEINNHSYISDSPMI